MNEWISVKDKLPEVGQLCVIASHLEDTELTPTRYTGKGTGIVVTRYGGIEVQAPGDIWREWGLDAIDHSEVAYWYPIPELIDKVKDEAKKD